MTAYKNRKAALAVTAGLVGALTLGGAAVAVTPAFADDGAQLQADWNAADTYVSAATNGKGQAVANPKDASFPAGSGQYLVPTAVKNKFGFEKSFTNPTGYDFKYQKQNVDGTWGPVVAYAWNGQFGDADAFFGGGFAAMGTYKVTVSTPDGTVNASQTFKLVNPSVKGITVAGAITYDGASTWQDKDLNLVDANKNHLVNGTHYKVSNVEDANGNALGNTGLIHAGTYKVTVDGIDAYAGTSETVTITVNKLDLSKAVVSVPDYDGEKVYWYAANYDIDVLGYKGDKTAQQAEIKLTGLTDPAGRLVNIDMDNFDAWESDVSGEYVATVKAVAGDTDVTGEAKVVFHKYDVSAGDLYYGKSTVLANSLGATGSKTIDLTAGESFDASKLAIRDRGNLYQAGFDVSYVDAYGNVVDASALSKPGTYHVLVHAKMTKNNAGQVVCGYYRFDVEVLGNKLNAFADVAFIWDGELSTSNSGNATYDGTDQLSRLATMVVDGDHNSYVEGKDYELTVKKAGYGEAVKEAVDAGTYTVTVTPKTFEFNGNATFTLTINPVKVSDLGRKTGLKDQIVTYTGSELDVPQAQYLVVNADKTTEYKPLDKALYKVDTIKDAKTGKVAKLQKAGKYAVTISLTDAAKGNYTLVDRDFIVTVREATSFDDVAADAWYAEPVEKAYDNGYVNGFAGTRLFGPERQITRADAVCILFNMAGGKDMSDGLFDYNASTGYETGFKDVNGKAYYAKALAWANETDVANGYGDGTFKPEAQITREEFAALLSNYAKLKGEYEAPTGDLSSFEDASSVSGWATEVVEWAVENGVLGNGGFLAGQSDITRAEVAAMAVNYQPKPVKNPVFSKFDK